MAAPSLARGMKTLDFAGTPEKVYEREDWPLEKLHDYFKNDTFALLGYGSQGHGQGLNLRDNGLSVIVGASRSRTAGCPARTSFLWTRLRRRAPFS